MTYDVATLMDGVGSRADHGREGTPRRIQRLTEAGEGRDRHARVRAMTAVLTFVLAYLATSILGAVAWASLAISKRRDRRIRAEREALRRETLAHALREPVA